MQYKNISSTLFLIISMTVVVGTQTATHRAPLDFDGDGKTDITVVRPVIDIFGFQPFQWWVFGSQANRMMPVITFGAFAFPGHLPIPADYDGDGKTDIAVFLRGSPGPRGNQSFFYVLRSLDGQVEWIRWGLDADSPYMTQDFDGDGKADPTVVRCGIATKPTTILDAQTWYILESRTNYQSYRVEEFGKCDGSRDRPIRGDFDGDGKADLAFFRELDVLENGQTRRANRFYMKLSGRRNTVRKVTFDYADDAGIVQGDFDGDGRTDIASMRSEGNGNPRQYWWYWLRSSDGQFVAQPFGYQNFDFDQRDQLVPGDYDGDGTTDLAIYRTAALGNPQAYFYIQRSRDGFQVVPWGLYRPDLAISAILYVR